MSLIGILLFYAVVIGAMWFFLMRPQSKEKKRVAAMISALEIGDCVLTTSGFYGIVIDITDDMVIVEFGSNKNCRIPMDKSAISRVEKPGEN
ncbi:preprotein translocase subunit YajC [bacterium D16-50]|nr:preprotein translocase subunit YajC [bacterium D16-50]